MRARRASSAAWLALAVLLATYAAWLAGAEFPKHAGYDMYHPWGIAWARDAGAANPYLDTPQVGRLVLDHARQQSSDALQAVARFWERRDPGIFMEPTGTPLYYALLGWLPRDFDAAHVLVTVLIYAALGAGMALLLRLRGWSASQTTAAIALVSITFRPFVQDVTYGNVNTIQFFVVAVAVVLAQRRVWERSAWVDRLYLPALWLFVLAKPNSVLVIGALAVHYIAQRPPQRVRQAALLSALVLALAAGAAAAWFHRPGIWSDWYLYTHGLNGGTLLYTAAEGNLSLAVMVMERDGLPLAAYTAISALVLAAATWVSLTARGREPRQFVPRLRALIADPWLMASAGVLATFALAPLLWEHYYVMALVPMLRFLRWPGGSPIATAGAIAAYVLMLRAVLDGLQVPGSMSLLLTVLRFAWLPLLLALFAQMSAPARA